MQSGPKIIYETSQISAFQTNKLPENLVNMQILNQLEWS